MATKTLLSLATVSLLAFAAKADDYTVETTNSWFSFAAATDSLTTNWSGAMPTREEEAVVIAVDTDADTPAFYTPTNALPTSSTRYRVKGNMTVTLNADVPANTVFGETLPKAALVAVAGSPNMWYGWNGSTWVELTDISAPEEGASYDVAIEFFVEESHLKIKYIVGTQSHTVQHSSLTALPALSKVGLAGYGSFGDFGALGFDSFEVTIDANKVADVKEAMGIEVDDEITPAALNEEGANGLTKWQSLVLGIDPRSTTKPYTAPVQTDNGNLGFTIGAAEIGKYIESGADVTVEVYSSDTANGTFTAVANQTQGSSSNQYKATVTPDSTGVKYYKIKIKFQ